LGDQVRVTTPTEAFEKGSDFLVMGRSFLKYLNNEVKEKND